MTQMFSLSSRQTDFEFAQRVVAGCDEAKEFLFTHFHNRVLGISLRFFNNHPEDAEDCTQEAFILIFRNIHLYRGDARLSTWLHRVTVNTALMKIRSEKKDRTKFDSLDEAFDVDEPLFDRILSRVSIHESFDDALDIATALERMKKESPGYHETILLRYIDGCEHEEIARRMNVGVGTSKSQTHKATLKMRRLLNTKKNPRMYQSVN